MTASMIGTRQMVVASNLPTGGLSCIRHCRRLRSHCWKGIEFYTVAEMTVTVVVVPMSVVAVTQQVQHVMLQDDSNCISVHILGYHSCLVQGSGLNGVWRRAVG
jgi:hypothetical protein